MRERATADLLQLGDAVEQAIRTALGTQLAPEARQRLEMILGDISTKEPGDAVPLAQARRDSRGIHVLREIGTAAAVERLIDLSATKSSNPTLPEEAREALRQI